MCRKCTQICRVIKSMIFIFIISHFFFLTCKGMQNATQSRIVPLVMLVLSILSACGTKEREFPGHSRDQVWKAMVQAAEDPRYADWVVTENQVWRDDIHNRIEILREVRRDVMIAGHEPRREQNEWKFTAALTDTDPPAVEFSTTTITVPAHFWLQARHYLDEVDMRLKGMPLEKKSKIPQVNLAASNKLPQRSEPLPVVVSTPSEEQAQPEIPNAPLNDPVDTATSVTVPVSNTQAAVEQEPIVEPAAAQPEPIVEKPDVDPTPVVQAEPATEPILIPEPVLNPQPAIIPKPIAVKSVPNANPVRGPKVDPDPTPDPTPEPTLDPTPEPMPEPIPEPIPEPTPDPTPEPTPAPSPTEPSPFEPPPDP